MTRNEKVFITIFYITKWTLGLTGRMRDYFGAIRNETIRKGDEGREKGKKKEWENNRGGRERLFLLNNQYFSEWCREE